MMGHIWLHTPDHEGSDANGLLSHRLNWQLHFGEPPKWSSSVKFILADIAPGQRDVQKAALSLTGDAGAIAWQLAQALPSTQGFAADHYKAWRRQLAEKVLLH